jgi:hypothetical protein
MLADSKIQSPGACCACDAMWLVFAHATAEHLQIQLDVYMATGSRDWDREAELNGLLIDAEARRETARSVIREHQDSEHLEDSAETP